MYGKRYFDNDGEKQRISWHTNTETGRVKVYERDPDGNIAKTLDGFEIENFHALKQTIGQAFKKMGSA